MSMQVPRNSGDFLCMREQGSLFLPPPLASYPGPFTRAVRAGRDWYQSFAHALNFTGILVK